MSTPRRTVLVTGASRGIGRAIAEAFASAGARVIGTHTGGRSPEPGICDEWIGADFSRADEIEACARRVAQIGPDVLVNNAGINVIAPFAEIVPADFLAIQQVNVYAPFRLCQSVIPAMVERGWGRIVNVSSIWGKISKERRGSYSASKFALDGMTVALAAEHSGNGILANSVAPGFTDTELTRRVLGESGMRELAAQVPVRRLGRPEEIAHFIRWLGSDENTYISGQNIAIDGGFTRV